MNEGVNVCLNQSINLNQICDISNTASSVTFKFFLILHNYHESGSQVELGNKNRDNKPACVVYHISTIARVLNKIGEGWGARQLLGKLAYRQF